MIWCLKSLSKVATCTKCGAKVAKGDQAWCDVDSAPRQVRCMSCGAPAPSFSADPGWYLLSVLLASELPPDIVVVPQYVVSATVPPVGHVLLASSGVWLVNALKTDDTITVSTRPPSIKVADTDYTNHLDPLVAASFIVSEVLPDLPIHPSLAFVGATWSDADSARLKRQGPFMVRKVSVSGPHSLIEAVTAPGPLTPRDVALAHRRLLDALQH